MKRIVYFLFAYCSIFGCVFLQSQHLTIAKSEDLIFVVQNHMRDLCLRRDWSSVAFEVHTPRVPEFVLDLDWGINFSTLNVQGVSLIGQNIFDFEIPFMQKKWDFKFSDATIQKHFQNAVGLFDLMGAQNLRLLMCGSHVLAEDTVFYHADLSGGSLATSESKNYISYGKIILNSEKELDLKSNILFKMQQSEKIAMSAQTELKWSWWQEPIKIYWSGEVTGQKLQHLTLVLKYLDVVFELKML